MAQWPIYQESVRSGGQPPDDDRNDRQTDLAWAAGFFDGEGYIGINAARRTRHLTRSFTLTTTLGQVDPMVVREFAKIVGEGKVYGPYDHRQKGHRPHMLWSTSGPASARVLMLLSPYLKHKRSQADIALRFQAEKRPNQGYTLTESEYQFQSELAMRLREIRASFGRS